MCGGSGLQKGRAGVQVVSASRGLGPLLGRLGGWRPFGGQARESSEGLFHSLVRQVMLAAGQDLSWGSQSQHLRVAPARGLGFLTSWWPRGSRASYVGTQGSKGRRPGSQGGSCTAFWDPASEGTQFHLGYILFLTGEG